MLAELGAVGNVLAQQIARRLKVYNANTAPLVEYYKAAGVLVSIDGMQAIDAGNADIEAALKFL